MMAFHLWPLCDHGLSLTLFKDFHKLPVKERIRANLSLMQYYAVVVVLWVIRGFSQVDFYFSLYFPSFSSFFANLALSDITAEKCSLSFYLLFQERRK